MRRLVGGMGPDMDDRRKTPAARHWLVMRIAAALIGVVLVAADVVWKLAAGWFAGDQGESADLALPTTEGRGCRRADVVYLADMVGTANVHRAHRRAT
jgi:hypothetical protein